MLQNSKNSKIGKPMQLMKHQHLLPIKGFQKTTLIDYPGHIASIIFLGGCNFRCDYCYNKDLVINPGILPGLTQETIVQELDKRKLFIDGVVITGGEPTLYPDLMNLFGAIKKLGLKIKLDSNGYQPTILNTIIRSGLIDYIAMDIKGPLERYQEITCVPLAIERIQESISLLKEGLVSYEFRTTVWKNAFTDNEFDAIFDLVRGAQHYYLQNMYPMFTIKPQGNYEPMSKLEILPILERSKQAVHHSALRGEWF
jgi:pyruvate formate lyase activating enzyme